MDIILQILAHPIFVSLAIIVVALLIKVFAVKVARKTATENNTDTRHLTQSVRHLVNILMLLSLLLVWSVEIQNFALSIAAFAVAIVLAFREYIQSWISFFYVMTVRPYRVGDWLRFEHLCGEVTSIDWLKTSLLEIDQETYQKTRHIVTVPNTKLVLNTVHNLNFNKRYVTHRFNIVIKNSLNGFVIYDELCALAKTYCEAFSDVAERYNSAIEHKIDSKLPPAEPDIRFSLTDIGDFKANFTIFCPTEQALHLEHQLTRDFMRLWSEKVVPNEAGNSVSNNSDTIKGSPVEVSS